MTRLFRLGIVPVAVAFASAWPGARGWAEVVQIAVEGTLSDRVVTLDVFERQGTRYVSMRPLIEQCGGVFSFLPSSARVELGGSSASIKPGQDRVHALSIFTLSHPVVQVDEQLLIALDDLPVFFSKSFRKSVRVLGDATGAPAPVPESTVVEPPPGSRPPSIVEPPPREAGPLESLGAVTPAQPPRAPGEYRTLVIDAGHGGYDTGAQAGEAVSEEDIALSVSRKLKARLATGSAVRTLFTRDGDTNLSAAQRESGITAVRPDFVVSIHVGTSMSPEVEGIAVFYPPPMTITTGGLLSGAVTSTTIGDDISGEARRLAQLVAASLAESTGAPLRGVVRAPVRPLTSLGVPAVLVEIGCLTNLPQAESLADEEYQGRVAEGIAGGILAFARNEPPQPAAGDAPGPSNVSEN